MPSEVPAYDAPSDVHEDSNFAQDSALKALDGCVCEEADLLRALAMEGSDLHPGREVVDLGSLGTLSHIALCAKKQRQSPPKSFFPMHRFYRLHDSQVGNHDPVPKFRVVREVVEYFAANDPPTEFVRVRPPAELDHGHLHFAHDKKYEYMWISGPFK